MQFYKKRIKFAKNIAEWTKYAKKYDNLSN